MTVNVDPTTGSIVRSGQDQQRFLEDGTPALDIQVSGTTETTKVAVDDAKANGKSLTLLLTVVPIVGFVGGVALPARRRLLLLRRRDDGAGEARGREAEADAGSWTRVPPSG